MEIIEFRKITTDDTYNSRYNDGSAWSRVYEYQLVLDNIKKHYNDNLIKIHNSSWGFDGVHVLFKEELDKLYVNTIHSDVKPSNLKNTTIYDITKKEPTEWYENFDVVINVSTLEEVNYNHVDVFNNLYNQVKPGGLLICTFDLPGLQIHEFENLFNKKLVVNGTPLTNHNSKLKNIGPKTLECGIMVIKKYL
jgi:SAM-dependent methyltransferase